MIKKKESLADNKIKKPVSKIGKVSVIFFHDAKVTLTVVMH